jgi:hypothetical protein
VERVVLSLLTSLLALVFGALDAAVFYLLADCILGYAVTWPVVLAVAWVVQGTFGFYLKSELKKQGLR